MLHAPTETSVTVAPDTVQTARVVEAKLTARPEDTVALTANGVVPYAWLESAPKVMVWLPCVT
jgi:CO dehydrogenase/acetyl-CoA synthase alpha subunit